MPLSTFGRGACVGGLVVVMTSAVLRPALAAEPSSAQCEAAYEGVQLARQQGKLLSARDQASRCMRESCPEVARKDCGRWADELAHEIPTVVVVARDASDRDVPGLRLLVDGVPRPEIEAGRAFELDPGAHVLRAERTDAPPVEQSFTVYQGERDRLLRIAVPDLVVRALPSPPVVSTPRTAPPPPDAPPLRVRKPSLVPPIVVGAVSVVALGASAFLGLTGRQELSDLRSTCAPACTDDQVTPVRTRLAASDVMLGVGIAGVVVAVTLFALRGSF